MQRGVQESVVDVDGDENQGRDAQYVYGESDRDDRQTDDDASPGASGVNADT